MKKTNEEMSGEILAITNELFGDVSAQVDIKSASNAFVVSVNCNHSNSSCKDASDNHAL